MSIYIRSGKKVDFNTIKDVDKYKLARNYLSTYPGGVTDILVFLRSQWNSLQNFEIY
jgi:hypothetical protein